MVAATPAAVCLCPVCFTHSFLPISDCVPPTSNDISPAAIHLVLGQNLFFFYLCDTSSGWLTVETDLYEPQRALFVILCSDPVSFPQTETLPHLASGSLAQGNITTVKKKIFNFNY